MSNLARAARPALKFVRLSRAPILSQLQLDEALLRVSTLNWCVVNAAPAAQRAVVLGCGGAVGKLVQAPACVADGVPLVRRCRVCCLSNEKIVAYPFRAFFSET